CDNIDNDCDGVVDDGNPGGGANCTTGQPGACNAGTTACNAGAIVCNATNSPTTETCDNIDNDCDGVVDDGNPGGGASCGAAVGQCGEYTVCDNGSVVCRGTFVGPAGVGAPGNPGTRAQPVATIAEAKAIAAKVGADICLCDVPAAGDSVYREIVGMIEGVSIYGGYNCVDWSRDITTYVTTIKGYVGFSNGITSATTLDGVNVVGDDPPVVSQQPTYSTAISITNSSPTLVNVKGTGGLAHYSWGLRIGTQNGGTASPTIIGGTFSAQGNGQGNYSEQTAITVTNAGGTFVNVTTSPGGASDTAMGFNCQGCSATITGGSISGGSSQRFTTGLYAAGNVTGLSVTNATLFGGVSAGQLAKGIDFDSCVGSPTLTGVDIQGGYSLSYALGVFARGAMCTPTIVNATISGGNGFNFNTGVYCSGAACTVKDSTIDAGIQGERKGVYCTNGGCNMFSGNTIKANAVQAAVSTTRLIDIRSSSPTFDQNELIGPPCPVPGTGGGAITYLQNSAAVLTNNILRDQTCVDATDLILSENAGPMLINNTLQLATCAGCGRKRGLVVNGSTGAGSVRNNILVNAGSADFTNAYLVYENNATSDLPFFENNALWAPNGGILYWDEGTTSLSLAAINGLMGSTANIHADPLLDATFHLLAASPCRNAGSAINAPAFDFDGDTRPREMSYDIGADEYVP
ncbi:MAG TPA: choice-of-anchor Q domain-containing protein, partial [Polyangium sp.]|nr:choice-of-anchor Q domain-containing protein [Polyangium sp.]